MSTISEKLTQLNTIKGDIKAAINNKGGEVGDDFSTYATAINNLSTGSGETYENPEFYEVKTQNGTNYDNLLRGYNGPDIDVSQWDTSKVTSAQYCFSECPKSMDISNWNLSSLTNASYMFQYFNNGNKYIDLSVLDFSNVTNADSMFKNSNTDYLDVRNIKLTGATSYYYLFGNCGGTELDLSTWDISNVTNLSNMCYSASYKKINLTGWKTTNVTNFGYIFYGYSNPLEILIMPDWDMTNATNTRNFIQTSASKLKYVDLSRSNDLTIKKIAPMLPTKTATTYGEILIPANTSQDAIDALIAKYWKPIGPKFDLNSTEVVLELDEIKPGKTTKVYNGNNDPWYGDDSLEAIEFISSDESIATVNGREITGVAEGTVTIECRRREDSVVVGSTTLTVSETDSRPNLIKFRIDESTLSSYYDALKVNGKGFKYNNLTKNPVTGIYSYDPGEQITSIQFGKYDSNRPLEIIKFNFNAANITNMSNIFNGYQGKVLDLSDWNTSSVIIMNSIFFVADSLVNINVSSWDTSNTTDMNLAFYGCESLIELDLSSWDTSNVTKMHLIFYKCNNLRTIKGELDLSNVDTTSGNCIYDAFDHCYNLETVYLKNIYKNSKIYNEKLYSISLGDTKVKDECLLYIINELPDLYAKGLTNTDQITFTLPPTNTLTQEQVQPAIDKGWTVVNVNF